MRSMGVVVGLALWTVSGCIGFSDDFGFEDGFGDGGFVEGGDVVVAERSLKVNLDETNPVQRFVLPIDVNPFSGSASIRASIVSASDTSIAADLNAAEFATDDIDNWFTIGPGLALQSSLFSNSEDLTLGLGTYVPPVSVELTLTIIAPADGDFDGRLDDVVGTIGDPRPVR